MQRKICPTFCFIVQTTQYTDLSLELKVFTHMKQNIFETNSEIQLTPEIYRMRAQWKLFWCELYSAVVWRLSARKPHHVF